MIGMSIRRAGFVALFASAIALIIGFAASPQASAVDAEVGVSSAETQIGYEVAVQVGAEHIVAPGLGAWTFDVEYNPEFVTVFDCTAHQNSLCNAGFSANAVRFVGTRVEGLTGAFDLGDVVFECKKVGKSALELSVTVFADATLGAPQPMNPVVTHGSLTCSDEPPPTETPKPEPTAEPPASEPDKLPGDADCNGHVDSVDAIFVLQYVVLLIDEVPCPHNADVNADGEINALDAALILQEVAGF